MAWRSRVVGLAFLAAGVGAATVYLKDYRMPARSENQIPSSYGQFVALKLESGQPVQIHISRCDLGRASQELILKVTGEIQNLGQDEIPLRRYSFELVDSNRRFYRDRSPDEYPDWNTFALRPGETRQFTTKYVTDLGVARAALDLVSVEGGTNFIQLKTAAPEDVTPNDGAWRVFRGPRWRP
jgi:hypothetical protein